MKNFIKIFFVLACLQANTFLFSQCNNLIVGNGCVLTNQALGSWINLSTSYNNGYIWIKSDTTENSGIFKYTKNPVNGYVLTSNTYGVATWQPNSAGTGTIVGNGTSGFISRFTGTSTIKNSKLYQINASRLNVINDSDQTRITASFGTGSGKYNVTLGDVNNNVNDLNISIQTDINKIVIGNSIVGGAKVLVNNALQYTDGSEGASKILTSDASGNATWSAPASGLPSQTNKAQRLLQTDGTNASWVYKTVIDSLATVTCGVWNGTIISPTYGGSGINNGTKTITLSGNLATTGAFNTTLATGFTGTITLPTATATLYSTQSASMSSAQLATSLSDKTGTGANVFGTAPTFTTSLISPIVYGSASASGGLNLASTSNGTKGVISFGTSGYDEVNNRLGLGTTVPTSILHIIQGQNAISIGKIVNSTAGTGSASLWQSISDVSNIAMGAFSSTYTTAGMFVQNSATLYTTAGSQMGLGTNNSAPLVFYTNNTEASRILTTGEMVNGATATIASEKYSAQGTVAGAFVGQWTKNSSTNAGAYAQVALSNSSTTFSIIHTSTGFTPSGQYRADCSAHNAGGTGGLSLVASNASGAIYFYSGGTTERMRLETTGNLGIGTTTTTYALNVNGDIGIPVVAKTLRMKSGTNSCVGQATLSSGTVTVSTTCVLTASKIFLTDATTGALTNVGTPVVGTIVNATSFVINSSNVIDGSNVNWFIINDY